MKKIKNYFEANKINIIRFLLLFLWIILFVNGWITLQRLVLFFMVLVGIIVYKKLIQLSIELEVIPYEWVTLLLLKIDQLKLILIKGILYLHIFIYYLLENQGENGFLKWYMVKTIEWLIKSLIINPFVLVFYKFYYLLNMWIDQSLKEIFIIRFLGLILSVLIFTPFLKYIFILFNNNWIYLYFLLVIISILNDNIKYLKQFKSLKYLIWFINLLRLNKNFYFMTEYRISSSIFSRLIKKGLCVLYERDHKINKHAYYINDLYRRSIFVKSEERVRSNNVLDMYKYMNKCVLSYDSFLMESKIMVSIQYKPFFKIYETVCLDKIKYSLFEEKERLIYLWLQDNYEFSEEDYIDLLKLDKITALIIKLLIFYYWNLLKLIFIKNNYNDNVWAGLLINNIERPLSVLSFDLFKSLSDKNFGLSFEVFKSLSDKNLRSSLNEKNKDYLEKNYLEKNKNYLNKVSELIKNKDFIKYRSFYEQMYLYSNIWDFDMGINSKSNLGLDYGEHNHINEYIDVFKENLKVLDKGSQETYSINSDSKFRLIDLREFELQKGGIYEEIIEKELILFKNTLISEWEEHSKDLTFDNFYKKNNENLDKVNYFVKNEIKNFSKNN